MHTYKCAAIRQFVFTLDNHGAGRLFIFGLLFMYESDYCIIIDITYHVIIEKRNNKSLNLPSFNSHFFS